MYKANSALPVPSDNSIIYRYTSIEKLIILLESKALYFCCVDNLDDKFEGLLTSSTLDINNWGPKSSTKELSTIIDSIKSFSKELKPKTFVNCWTISDFESNAMWKTYLPDGKGIAIKSTFGNACRSFGFPEHEVFFIKKLVLG